MRVDAIGTVRTFEDTGIDPAPVDAGAAWDATGHGEIPEPSTESLSERANRSVEQMRKEFAEIQKQNDEWRNNVLRMNVAQADNAVPDDEARVNELAKQFNAPADMVRNYRKLFEAQARNLKLAELQKTNPKTAEFLTDPNNARIAHDDIDNLARTEDAIDSVLAYPQAFAAGIVRDFLGNRIKGATERILSSNYTTRMMQDVYAGAIGLSDDRLASQWDDIDAVEYKTMRDIIMTPAQAVIAAGNRIDVPDKQKTFGVQVAAGLGQVAGQIASAFIDPAGQLSALIDQGIGAVSDDVQKDIEAAREAGVDVDFSRRLAAILGGGAATGVTEKLSLELIGSPLASRIASRAARFAARTLVGGLSEGAQEVLESFAQTLIRQQFTNPGAKYQTGAEMFDEFTVSGAVGAIVANMLGLRRFRIGQATEKGIKSLNDEAKASKLRGRDKQVYETLVSTQTEGTPLENAYINTEAWRTYFQSQGLDPKEQAERYGVTNYDEAVATGSDLSIPFPAYQADFSASDHAPNFVRDTKLSENGMTVNEQEAYMQRLEERAKETESLLERIGKESENARAVNDVLSRLTDDIAVQLEPRYDKKTAHTLASVHARASFYPIHRDIIERAKEQGKELSPDEMADQILEQLERYGLTINPNATQTTLNTRRNIDPAIDSMIEKLRKNEIPKEREVYGQSLTEYVRKKGGIRPDDVVRDLVRNKQLPRSILNEKGMGADELAALQDVLDFGIETESMQADNALLDALVNEYTTGEKRYSNAQLNAGLLAELQALDNLSRDLAAAGIDLNADNATIRDALSKYYEEQNGQNTGKESQTAETERYEQRGFTESDIPTAEERAEANRQYDEIEKKYRRTPLWMKAPNGEPTKLTERQWVQVRTPNFKRWFGDWEKAGIRERLEGQEPILVKSKFTEETARIKKSEAAALLKEPFGVKKNIGEVFVTRNGIRDSIAHSRYPAKLDVIPHLREILEKAEYLDTLNDFDGKDIQNHYFVARINHDGRTKLVFLRVRERANTRQLYVHDVFLEDEIKKADSLQTSPRGRSTTATRGTSLYKSILQDIYATDNESVSKVVDSNGEPKASDVEVFASDQNILYQREPVVRLTGNELGNSADIFDAARNWYKQNLQGTSVNRSEIGDIRFSGKGWNKVKRGIKGDSLKAKIIPAIRDVIAHGKYHGRTGLNKSRTDDIVAFHYFTADVSIGDDIIPVGVNVGEDVYGNLFYNINHHPDDLLKKKAPILPREEARGLEPDNPRNHQSSSHGPRVQDTESDVLEQSIGQNEDGVNMFILNEKNQGKVRGATIINPDRTMRIELFKDANYSTFVHETAHFMLEVYGDLASDPQSSEYIRNEYATIRQYLGTKDGEAITREQHEKFARSFEAYLMEGKAPSPELQGIFSRFKNWLLNIYRSMRGLRVNLNKDIREVFDRMLASDEEIAVMRDASELQPLFATAEKMGIAQDEFDAYLKIAEKELIAAQDRFRQKAMKAKLREKRKGYKEELEAEKNRVEKEYDRDPVVAAFNDLTSDNGLSLNEAELRRIYGKAFLAKLPRKNGKRIYSKDGNVSLEELAEGLGFNSGDELIRAIAQLPDRQTYVEDKARQNIIDREGDVLNSENIADEAENALHNEYMEQRLKKELAILNRLKRAGKAAKLSEQRKRIEQRKEAKRIEEDVNAQVEAMEVAARSVIAEKPVKELKPNLYLRAMQKASRKARQELDRTDPDYTAAARQKQAEIMNNILYREATRVRKELDRRTLQAKAVVRKPLKDAVKTRDSLFVNRAKYIAAKLGLGGNAGIIMQRIRTEEQNRQDVEPFRYDLAAPLRELNTATALDVLEDVKANWDQARRGKVMLIDGKRVEIDEAAKAISDKLADFGKTWRSSSRDDSLRNKLLKQIGSMVLDQTRMEAWCDMVDGARLGEETGPWMKYVFNPVKQAADKTRLSQAEYTKRLTEIIDSFRFTRETIEAPELGYTFGKDTGYGKAELIHALLHTGNMSNFQRLLVGRGWGSVLNGQVNAARWNAFMSRMIAEGRITEKDMDGVQKIWDVFDELKPQSQKAYKEVFGRYFDEITATPFFEFGKRYAGGYVPVIYDSRESGAGEKQLNPTMDLLNEMGTAFPRLQAGWGNSRKEGNFGPLLLDLSRLRDHISRQILFANMAPVNKDVSRLLNRKNVSDTIRGYDPEFMGTALKPWLSRAITQNLEASGKKPAPHDKVARELRTRAGAITMFGNVVNAIEQVFDMTAAYSKVKGRYLTDAFRTMVSDRAGTVKAVMDASDYMRGRMSAEIMAANGRLEQALRPGRLKKLDRWLIDHAYFLQASVDNFCGPLTWMAAYNQATESGLSHRDAVLQADSVVRQVFGANAAEDVANFEAGGTLKRLFSQFTGYFIQRANLISGEYSKIQRSDIANKKAAVAILLLQTALLPAWIGAALRKFAAGGDDDETYASWLLDVFGWGTFNYGLSMGGQVGQIANAAIDRLRGKSFASGRVFYPPAFKIIEDFIKSWKILPDIYNGELDTRKFIRYLTSIENAIPGIPIIPARPVATARYIYDVATDEVQPTGGYDFVRGVVTGRASADSRQ